MLTSLYAAPRITPRFWPVVLRNLLVWRKLAVPSVVGNIAEPLITLVAFGYGLGALVGQIGGLPYIEYLASGSVDGQRGAGGDIRGAVFGVLAHAGRRRPGTAS